jgi:hypothetical protein
VSRKKTRVFTSTEVVAPPARTTPADFRGCWRIESMEVWDREAIDTMGPAFIYFEGSGGTFRFICVEGDLDCEFGQRGGRPLVQWSWNGQDEMDPASGRGWAVLMEDGTLEGKIFIHHGDSSDFKASKSSKDLRDLTPSPPPRWSRRRW